MIIVDGRCSCSRCEARTKNIYRMVGSCSNCGTTDILVIYRAGDLAGEQDCPVCDGFRTVHVTRLATPDEIPAVVPPSPPAAKTGDE